MPARDRNLSPCDRMIARRRRRFIRDWILVLIAVGLAITAGVFRSDRGRSERGQSTGVAAFVR